MHGDGDGRAGIRAGRVGRVFRLITGLALVAEGGRHLLGSSSRVLMKTGGVIIGEILFYALLHAFIVRVRGRINPWLGAVLAVVPVATVFLLSDAPGRLGSLLFIGVSLLLTAWRADGGCEVMTIPGMMLGKRTHLVCIAFSPIDWLEERIGRAPDHEAPEGEHG